MAAITGLARTGESSVAPLVMYLILSVLGQTGRVEERVRNLDLKQLCKGEHGAGVPL